MSRNFRFFFPQREHSRGLPVLIVFASTLFVSACIPPSEPEEAHVQDPEPTTEGEIPWAPGEAPTSAEATTRDVAPEPKEEEPGAVYYEDDGIKEANSGPVCSGKAPPDLRAAVDVRAQETKDCSSKISLEQAGARGDMKVSLRITRTGQVDSVEVLSDSLGVPEVASCVKEILNEPFADARPRGGCAVFVLPLHFESVPMEANDAQSETSDTKNGETAPEE